MMVFKLKILVNGIISFILIFLFNSTTISGSFKTRRILLGRAHFPHETSPFMVYILKTNESKVKYIGWLCGGAIVHPQFILTSAACLEDVGHMYAIAGYEKYVNSDQVNNDRCTKKYKMKIIQTCVPREYELVHEKKEKWSVLDIGLAKVEQPYDFNDEGYTTYCSYKPAQAKMSFSVEDERRGDFFVLGWGHNESYRNEKDITDYNSNQLLGQKVLITDSHHCKRFYKEISAAIDKYMICTDHPTYGFCQNDHGGPLVNYEGMIIGVMSIFAVEEETLRCRGPYLYTSTNLMQVFIQCVLYGEDKALLRRCKMRPDKMDYSIAKRNISWTRHPDGPAANEVLSIN